MTSPAALEAHPDGHSFNLSQRQKTEILGAILLALFLFALDQTVVGTALPRIVTDLNGQRAVHVGDHDLPADRRRSAARSTASCPTCSAGARSSSSRSACSWSRSVFAGLSQEMWQFIAFRGLQGLGGGAVFPVALAVMADLYTPGGAGQVPGPLRRRVRALVDHRARPSAASSPTTSAGTGSSSSTCRSG